MTNNNPITPPPELFKQWDNLPGSVALTAAYRAGADAELEACCEHLKRTWAPSATIDNLRTNRRPKPPSLAEQALEQLNGIGILVKAAYGGDLIDDHIRAALERLQELEKLSDDQG